MIYFNEIEDFVEKNKEEFNEEQIKVVQNWKEKIDKEDYEISFSEIKQIADELGIFECEYCLEFHFKSEAQTTEDGYELCEYCWENATTYCPYCNGVYLYDTDFRETTDGDLICESCADNYSTCYDCGRVIVGGASEYYAEDTGHTYCGDCAEDRVTYCDGCGNYFEDTNYSEDDDCCYCDNCNSKYNVIHDYGYKPAPIFQKLDKEKNPKEFMGVEVEIDYSDNRDVLREVENDLGIIYWKHDGSLDEGAEMVSEPCTIKKWMELKEKFGIEFQKLIDAGYRSHDTSTCGYHIHISRDSLGKTRQEQDATIDRMILITETFKEELKKFSRRKNFGYCHFASESGSSYADGIMDDLEKCKYFKDHDGSRYLVINNNNSATVEFRVFRGTLNINTFIAALQLVHNIANISKKRDIRRFNGIKWADIINYTKDFKELKDYNKLRGIKSSKVLKTHKEAKGE